MRRYICILMIIATLMTSSAIVLAADPLKSDQVKTVQFNKEFCKTVSRNPLVTVCVSGNPDQAKFNKRTQKNLEKSTRKLLAKYRKLSTVLKSSPKFNLNCGPMPSLTDPAAYALWMACMMTPPPPPPSTCTFADWDPAQCGGGTYCEHYPSDPMCSYTPPPPPPSTCTFADWDPVQCGGATYCDHYPSDPLCSYTPPPPPPSTCTFADWDPAQCGGGTYCDHYPSDPLCSYTPPPPPPSTCTFADWDPAQCGGATYCDHYPSDPMCP